METKKRNSFSGSIGFILAAAGSAVGLGNIWRFPYLAARDGGGLFLLVYLVLTLTFGFTLLTTELAIGRKTKQSASTAFGVVNKKWKSLGILPYVICMIILPYYCVIGGWILKYFVAFVCGDMNKTLNKDYFSNFISDQWWPIIFAVIFLGATAIIVFNGINDGIEKFSKFLMPILILIIIIVAIFSITIKQIDANGVTRTGFQGFKMYLIPNFDGITVKDFISVVVDAVGQLFYSISVAMGIMVTYGSYVKDEEHIGKSTNMIEVFDTGVAFLAGAMVIPVVFTYMGKDGLAASGPSLIFESLPKAFSQMGDVGGIVGILFFAMVLFAAITSSVSLMENLVSSNIDVFHVSRKKSVVITTLIVLAVGVIVCLGYNILAVNVDLPNGSTNNTILDILDYSSNNLLMPLLALLTCILIGWVVKPKYVIDEVEKTGKKMGRKVLYVIMIKFVAPICLIALLLKSLGLLDFLLN